MLYVPFKVGEKELKLRINGQNIAMLEQKLGRNPLDILIASSDTHLPKVSDMVAMLHASLQAMEHGYTEEKVWQLYDEYVDNGGDMKQLLELLEAVLKESGLIPREEPKEAKKGKNA